MREIGNIYLSWKRGAGGRRYIVGVLKKNSVDGVRFRYIKDGVRDAKAEGFSLYTEFPEIDKEYSKNVLETFGQRLIKAERSDISSFIDFWEISPKYLDDTYYMLAHTMGLTPTDNFEFLANYHPVKGLRFISDIAGLTSQKLPANTLSVGDKLTLRKEDTNPYDKRAVAIFKEETKIGYVKVIHNRVFHKRDLQHFSVEVKALDVNGVLKKAFVKFSL
ncbi:MAG: HIRAN domain-containing protein [Imperialibacter sp.]|uniref:HIRAN domain-containing protein n=1 Tax=Imperialibacter sp. TaxID=2038411 RepID=UPI0032EE3FA9